MSHTAGPWAGFLSERDGHAAWLIGPSSARPILAEVSADAEYGLTGATVEANARLIARAPDMEEAGNTLSAYIYSILNPGEIPESVKSAMRVFESLARAGAQR